MKHVIGIGVLVAMAFGLRSSLQTGFALDIPIHDTYWVVPLRIITFWCLLGIAFAWSVLIGFMALGSVASALAVWLH